MHKQTLPVGDSQKQVNRAVVTSNRKPPRKIGKTRHVGKQRNLANLRSSSLTFPSLYQTIFGHFWGPPVASEATASTTHVKFNALRCSTCLAESLKISIFGAENSVLNTTRSKIERYYFYGQHVLCCGLQLIEEPRMKLVSREEPQLLFLSEEDSYSSSSTPTNFLFFLDVCSFA